MYLLNPPIILTAQGLLHTVEQHTHSGIAKYAHKSKFNSGENIEYLITLATHHLMVSQSNGRLARTYRLARNIGLDSHTGNQTDIITVITEPNGVLVTAFPGKP